MGVRRAPPRTYMSDAPPQERAPLLTAEERLVIAEAEVARLRQRLLALRAASAAPTDGDGQSQ